MSENKDNVASVLKYLNINEYAIRKKIGTEAELIAKKIVEFVKKTKATELAEYKRLEVEIRNLQDRITLLREKIRGDNEDIALWYNEKKKTIDISMSAHSLSNRIYNQRVIGLKNEILLDGLTTETKMALKRLL